MPVGSETKIAGGLQGYLRAHGTVAFMVSGDFLFRRPSLAPVTRGLIAATILTTLLAGLLPEETKSSLLHPCILRPWTLVLACLYNVVPLWFAGAVAALWYAGPYFDDCLTRREFVGIYLGCGALGHAFCCLVLGAISSPGTAGLGSMYGLTALAMGVAHFNGRQQVSLYGGVITLELRQLVVFAILLEAATVVHFGAKAAPSAGRAAAGLVAWLYFNKDQLPEFARSFTSA